MFSSAIMIGILRLKGPFTSWAIVQEGKIVIQEWLKSTPASIFVVTKTHLYDFDPRIPHFYIVKGVYRGIHFFPISA